MRDDVLLPDGDVLAAMLLQHLRMRQQALPIAVRCLEIRLPAVLRLVGWRRAFGAAHGLPGVGGRSPHGASVASAARLHDQTALHSGLPKLVGVTFRGFAYSRCCARAPISMAPLDVRSVEPVAATAHRTFLEAGPVAV